MRTEADRTTEIGALPAAAMTREDALLRQYGELVSLKEIAFQLKFPTAEAARKSHERGHLALELFRLPKRRGLYAYTRALAHHMNQSVSPPKRRKAS
jgi:hypothetical protein